MKLPADFQNREAHIYRSVNALALFSITVVFLSIALYGLVGFRILGNIDVAIWDFAIIFVLILWVPWFLVGKGLIYRHLIDGMILLIPLLLWVGLEMLRSPQVVRGFTMFLMLLRGYVIFFVIGTFAFNLKNLRDLNNRIFFCGAFIAALSLFLYFYNLGSITGIMRKPFGNTILMVEPTISGKVPRLIGFSKDPNFYALSMTLPFLCGQYLKSVGKLVKFVGVIIIGSSILLTLSRSAIIFLCASWVIVSFILTIFQGARVGWRYFRVMISAVVIIAFIVIAVGTNLNLNVVKNIDGRFHTLSTVKNRLAYIEILSEKLENPIIGAGLRGSEEVLGRYAHNSYVELLYDTGIVGFSLWLMFLYATTKRGITLLRYRADIIPWFHAWVFTLFMSTGFSITYFPLLWIIAAVIWSQPRNFRLEPEPIPPSGLSKQWSPSYFSPSPLNSNLCFSARDKNPINLVQLKKRNLKP